MASPYDTIHYEKRWCWFFWISDASKIPVESDTDDDGAPQISLAEMLEELSLTDATGGEGADMMTD